MEDSFDLAPKAHDNLAHFPDMTTPTYCKGGQGAHIRFATAPCPLGYVLVAATEHGVCSVRWGADAEALVTTLSAEFPAATLERDEKAVRSAMKTISDYLDGALPFPDLPLDIKGTAFQWRVWKELQTIPAGETRTYTELAHQIGRPTAVRAVARACATNPIALVHPCHRIVSSSGKLAGSTRRLERKLALIEREKANIQSRLSEPPDY